VVYARETGRVMGRRVASRHLEVEGSASFLKKRSKKLLDTVGFGNDGAKTHRTKFFCYFLFTKSSAF
jgi:hypothetical protein